MPYEQRIEESLTATPDLIVAAASLAKGSDAHPFALVPAGYSIRSTERLLGDPIRSRRVTDLRTVASFLTFFKEFVSADARFPGYYQSSLINGLRLDVVLNPNSWADSRVSLLLGISHQLRRWLAIESGGSHRQKAFASFIEENLADIVEPQGAKLLEICRAFRATQTVRFSSSVDLANGDVGLEYITETKAGTVDSKSRLQVPETITLGLPIYEGEERIKIKAKLLYSIDDGQLRLGIKFPQLDDALEAMTENIIQRIGKTLPKVPLMNGVMHPIAPIEFSTNR